MKKLDAMSSLPSEAHLEHSASISVPARTSDWGGRTRLQLQSSPTHNGLWILEQGFT